MSGVQRIGIIMQGGAGWAGGAEYIRNLILGFNCVPAGERAGLELYLVSGLPVEPALAEQLQSHVAGFLPLSRHLPEATLARRVRWLVDRRLRARPNTRFAEFVASSGLDVLYPLTYDNQYNIGLSWPVQGALARCRWAGWIPDFQHRFMPDLFSEAEIAKRDAGIATLAHEARTIVFSSHSAAQDFRRFYPFARPEVKVLHFHTNPTSTWFERDAAEVQRQFFLPDEFLLVSNQFWQHKNHTTLFSALALLRRRGLRPTLVCTGQTSDFRKKDYFNTLLRQIHECGIAPQVHVLGLIARDEQIQLMRRCLAVVQPSLFEGWSTVLEDARALGKPVIASDIAVHREQNVPGCRFFAKESPDELAAAITEFLATSPRPGPNLEDETAARAAAEAAMLRYGRTSINILRNSLE